MAASNNAPTDHLKEDQTCVQTNEKASGDEPQKSEPDFNVRAEYTMHTDEAHEDIQTLLSISEFYSNLLIHHPNERPHDFIDVICGWESTVPCPVYASNSPVVSKKRRTKTFVDDRRYKTDDSTFTLQLREGVIEPDTFRYVPNNGQYRISKEKRKGIRSDTNYTFMPPKRNSYTEQRLLQRQARLDSRVDVVNDEDEDSTNLSNLTVDRSKTKDAFHPQVRGREFPQRKKEKPSDYKHESHILSKAFTETIMQNFSSKISAIEDHIRGEANWWAMTSNGADYTDKKVDRRPSLPESLRVLSKPTLGPIPKVNQISPKVSKTGPNTPRFSESYILNPLNLEAARSKLLKGGRSTPNRRRREDTEIGFQSSAIGRSNPRDKKLELINEPDLSPVALPELFGKKLGVTVAGQKWL